MDLGYNPFSDKPISITRHRHYNPSSDRGLFLHPTLAVFQCAAPAAVGMPIEMLGVSQCQKPRKMDGFSMKQKQRCGGQKLREITGAFEKKTDTTYLHLYDHCHVGWPEAIADDLRPHISCMKRLLRTSSLVVGL